jgi:peptidoglycan/LPS O-acetylase OafA/YrhL
MIKLTAFGSESNNNFNLLRMIAASAVLVSHAYPISLGEGTVEPLESLLKMNLGTLSVITFFAISGFFILQSFDHRNSLISFCVARILRIYPGLIVVLMLTLLVLGPTFTAMAQSDYFCNRATLLYLPHNISLKWLQYDLPGVFRDNPFPDTINGSLWSLFYEVVCYGMVVAVGVLGLTRRKWRFSAFLGVYALGYLTLKPITLYSHDLAGLSFVLVRFHQLTLPFVVGMTFYQFRSFLRLNWLVCVGAGSVAVLTYGTAWFQESFVVFWCYLIFYLGFLPVGPLRVYNLIGDYSYGMYIYAFPCEQIAAALCRGISPLGVIITSLPITLGCAVLSWHLVERRALAHRAVAANWVERKFLLLRRAPTSAQ